MKTNRITLRPDHLSWPLMTISAGKLSSAVFTITGDIPDDVDTLAVQISRTPNPETGAARENFTVAASETTEEGAIRRTFRAYLNPYCFPDASNALQYFILATDESGNVRWLGTGRLIVEDNPANGSAVIPGIIPADTYLYNPANGLYYKLRAFVNEEGQLVPSLDQEGVTR